MSVEKILDKLDDTIDESWVLPLSKGRRVVDADKVQDLLEDIRLNFPSEMRQAKIIVEDRLEIIKSAKKEAETIIQKAKNRAALLVIESEIVRQAKEKAREIIENSKRDSDELKRAVFCYCENILKTTEVNMQKTSQDMKRIITHIRAMNQGQVTTFNNDKSKEINLISSKSKENKEKNR